MDGGFFGWIYFFYFTVNDSYFFDPVDRNIHAQNVEKPWRLLKENLPESIRRGERLIILLYLKKI